MKKSLKIFCLCCIALGSTAVVTYGQQPDQHSASGAGGFVKQIEIQKDYSATITTADRIEREPRLLDTAIVRPSMRYNIISSAEPVAFATSPLSPIAFSTARWHRPSHMYLNIGMGLPLQSELDFYYSPVVTRSSHLAVFLNHEGNEHRQINLSGERLSALSLRNRAGVIYNTAVGRSSQLSTSLTYRGVVANPYGGYATEGAPIATTSTHDVEFKANLHGGLGESETLGYDANLFAAYAMGCNYGAVGRNSSVGRYSMNFALTGLDAKSGWLPERVTLHFFGVGSWHPVEEHEYQDSSVTLVPEWSFDITPHLPARFVIGYDYVVVPGAKQSTNGVMAAVELAYTKKEALVPYIKITNDFDTGLLRQYMWLNPYADLITSDSRKLYRMEAGVRGNVAKRVEYKAAAGRLYYSRYFYAAAVEGSHYLNYIPDARGLKLWYAEAEALYKPLRNLTVEGALKWQLPSKPEENMGYGIRPLEARLAATYEPWQRWSFGIEASYLHSTTAPLLAADGTTVELSLPCEVLLGARAEYRATDSVVVWLRGDNLLNQTSYFMPTYQAMGAGVRAGVRLIF